MANDSLVGTQLGAYFIQAKLGEGGMAQVYKAYHARLRREVAIKVILPQIADQTGFRERFEREAQLIASLEHRNIVAVYDYSDIGNLTYLVMQYVGGGTLRDLLRREGKIEPHKAVQYAIQMARALHHAHQRGIVHRDVKPQNMLISASGPDEILLSDFGIAKLFDSGSSQENTLLPGSESRSSDPSLTNVDQLVGTAEYMAPEQINRQAVDARTDVYALGIVLFQMLVGQVPFSSTTIQGLLFQHVYTAPKPIREINPAISPVLEQIILRALAKIPEQRYQSAEAMALALEAVLTPATHPLSAPLSGNYPTATAFSPADQVTNTPQTLPARSPHSYYGQQGASIGQPLTPAIQAGSGNIVLPAQLRAKRRLRPSYLLYSLVIILGIVLISSRVLLPALCNNNLFCLTSSQTSQTVSGNATPFSESFQNNDRNWTIGGLGNLTASFSGNRYILQIGSATKTYFPFPSSVGTLPVNFTLTARIAKNMGGTDVFYGLAFRLKQNGSKVYCYAFVINGSGDYEVLKYNADASTTPTRLWSGQMSGFQDGQSNTLQVTAQGNKYSFKVNNSAISINGANQTSDTDHAYTGGQLGLLVAGPNTAFTVTGVMLAT